MMMRHGKSNNVDGKDCFTDGYRSRLTSSHLVHLRALRRVTRCLQQNTGLLGCSFQPEDLSNADEDESAWLKKNALQL